ncbi:hypothetical protein [Piscinibacter koreensis]|uniref:Uncharacterized protein n=1 Tax=Piscinibacter koreensis TaxID=2742824 RepID=A0A7Y6TX57_9BURK|nr:hypothetical protein [Schlegelella koreensis]NUZ06752.1 hypothetical protein [Schlegelella koreensis]
MSKKTPDRASANQPLEIDCAALALRKLMTEQCRMPDGIATYYSGTRAQFMAAGFPERSLPTPKGRRTKLRLAPGGSAYQPQADAWISPDEDGNIELEIHWSGNLGNCGHLALTEIARTASRAVAGWALPRGWNSKEVPTDRLFDYPEIVKNYGLPRDRRFKYTPEFLRQLHNLAHTVFLTICAGEVLPIEAAPAVPMEVPEADTLGAERLARALIASAKGQHGA